MRYLTKILDFLVSELGIFRDILSGVVSVYVGSIYTSFWGKVV